MSKRVVVLTRTGKRLPTDWMPDDEAEALRRKAQEDHAAAGDALRWIEVGRHSIQSHDIEVISTESPSPGPRVARSSARNTPFREF
jgi:hypothetical protein